MITSLTAADRPRWTELWRGYLVFYETALPDEIYDATWNRLMQDRGLHGFGLRHDGELVGLVHYLFHESAWTLTQICYLQDLFIDPAARGTGGGRTLIEAVAGAARARDAAKMYWLTQSHNATARRLYDRLAKHRGFIRYDYPL